MIWDVLPGSGFFFPDPEIKKALDPGSGSATLLFTSNAKRVAVSEENGKNNVKSCHLADAEKE